MSLTQSDLQEIRTIVQEVVEPIKSEIQALRNDIKEIYGLMTKLQSGTITDKSFATQSLEKKLLTLNAELLSAAKQAGVVLPRN